MFDGEGQITAVMATPGPFGRLGLDLCSLIAEHSKALDKPVNIGLGDHMPETAKLVLIEFASNAVLKQLVAQRAKVVIFADTPSSIICPNKVDPISYLRSVSLSYSVQATVASALPVLVFDEGWAHGTIADFIEAVARALGDADLDNEAVTRSFLGKAPRKPLAANDVLRAVFDSYAERFDPGAPLSVLLPTETAEILEPLATLPLRSTTRIEWSPHLFEADGQNRQTAAQVIDLTGPARTILWGPYLYLPVGRWELCLRVSVDDDGAKKPFVFEVVGDGASGEARLTVGKAGTFDLTFDALVNDPSRPIEIRVRLDRGAIFGSMTLDSVSFTMSEPAIDLAAMRAVADR